MQLTICIPYYNDSENLNELLNSIYECDRNNLKYEIIVCGFDNENKVHNIVDFWRERLSISLIDTRKKTSASINLNKGLKKANGKIFCRIDSHCLIDKNYLKNGIIEFNKNQLMYSAIGPSVEIIGQTNSSISRIISKLYMSPFLLGPSKFKRSFFYKNFSGPTDSIFLGFYLTSDLRDLGGFDENLLRKQDIDLLSRLKKMSNKGFYNSSSVIVKYILKQDSLFKLAKRCYSQGTYLFESSESTRIIHYVPILALVMFLIFLEISLTFGIFLLSLYLFLCFIFGLIETFSLASFTISLVAFPFSHIAYVTGNLVSLFKKILGNS